MGSFEEVERLPSLFSSAMSGSLVEDEWKVSSMSGSSEYQMTKGDCIVLIGTGRLVSVNFFNLLTVFSSSIPCKLTGWFVGLYAICLVC